MTMNNKSHSSTMVCVTDQFNCERIIKSGKEIADKTNTQLHVINIINSKDHSFGDLDMKALEYLFKVSKENDAIMAVVYSDNFVKTIDQSVKQHRVVNLLTGVPANEHSVLHQVWSKIDNVQFYVVTPLGDIVVHQKKENSAVR